MAPSAPQSHQGAQGTKRRQDASGGSSGKKSRLSKHFFPSFDEIKAKRERKDGGLFVYFQGTSFEAKELLDSGKITRKNEREPGDRAAWKLALVDFDRDAIDTLSRFVNQPEKTGASEEDVERLIGELKAQLRSKALVIQAQDRGRLRIQDLLDLLQQAKDKYEGPPEGSSTESSVSRSHRRSYAKRKFLQLWDDLQSQQMIEDHKGHADYGPIITQMRRFHGELTREKPTEIERIMAKTKRAEDQVKVFVCSYLTSNDPLEAYGHMGNYNSARWRLGGLRKELDALLTKIPEHNRHIYEEPMDYRRLREAVEMLPEDEKKTLTSISKERLPREAWASYSESHSSLLEKHKELGETVKRVLDSVEAVKARAPARLAEVSARVLSSSPSGVKEEMNDDWWARWDAVVDNEPI